MNGSPHVLARLRDDVRAIGLSAMAASRADTLLGPRLARWRERPAASAGRTIVIAAGKAAGAMLHACLEADLIVGRGMVATTHVEHDLPPQIEVHLAGHPVPTAASEVAARRALTLASGAETADTVLVLLSGGASALLSLPAPGLRLEDKMAATRVLLTAGAAIDELNCVRKHLSGVKGGRLAAASHARLITWALSDVVVPVEDDPSVIGSGPTVADPSTFADALAVVDRLGVRDRLPQAVVDALCEGAGGGREESPKEGDPRLRQSAFEVVGGRRDAMRGASAEAEERGYEAVTIEEPIVGEARVAGPALLERALALASTRMGPVCVLASGETTVRVTGTGRGGRNQELALAIAPRLVDLRRPAMFLSLGTDGVDGPTDAAGALADGTTCERARRDAIGESEAYLRNNDAYHFFDRLGDLVRTGRSHTNVGDVQILLLGAAVQSGA